MDIIELMKIRHTLPDLTMYYDKKKILETLRLLCVDVGRDDGDEVITIWLENDYYITWRPFAAASTGSFCWGQVLPLPLTHLDRLMSSESEPTYEVESSDIREFLEAGALIPAVMYRIWATLHHTQAEQQPVATPRVLRDCQPDVLLRESLTWFQRETNLPLRIRHLDFIAMAKEGISDEW